MLITNEVFQTALENNIQTRRSFWKFKCPFCKTDTGQMALSCIGPTIWSKTPDMPKQTKNLNMFKHYLKEHYLKEIENSNFNTLQNKSLQYSPFYFYVVSDRYYSTFVEGPQCKYKQFDACIVLSCHQQKSYICQY